MTDEEVDKLLQALNEEGFALPYSARSSDYLSDPNSSSAQDPERRAREIAALRAADEQAWQQNRDALRRSLARLRAADEH